MKKFVLSHIDNNYIRYLHDIDNKVQYNKEQKRPYLGIVFRLSNEHGSFLYFAPLESPKPRHKELKNTGPIMKLDEGKLGIIGFNNMIPVPKKFLVRFDISEENDERYKRLLLKQLHFCNDNCNSIIKKATMTYYKVVKAKNPFYMKTCCDFKKLESKVSLYDFEHE